MEQGVIRQQAILEVFLHSILLVISISTPHLNFAAAVTANGIDINVRSFEKPMPEEEASPGVRPVHRGSIWFGGGSVVDLIGLSRLGIYSEIKLSKKADEYFQLPLLFL